MTPAETVLLFLDRVNQRDPDQLAALMAEDHVFTDSLGHKVEGREAMRAGWRAYYAMCPDYWVSHGEILTNGDHVAVFGEAGGTIAANPWRIRAAWLARVENGLIKEWSVYADNKPVYDLLKS